MRMSLDQNQWDWSVRQEVLQFGIQHCGPVTKKLQLSCVWKSFSMGFVFFILVCTNPTDPQLLFAMVANISLNQPCLKCTSKITKQGRSKSGLCSTCRLPRRNWVGLGFIMIVVSAQFEPQNYNNKNKAKKRLDIFRGGEPARAAKLDWDAKLK